MSKKMIKGYIYVIISAILFGCMPLGAKFLYARGMNSISLVFWRNSLALPVLAILAFKQTKSFYVEKKTLLKIVTAAAMGVCATPILLYSSYNYLASGTATIFHFIYPVVVVMGSILFLHEQCNKKIIFSVIICTLGILLFYDPDAQISFLGSFLALLSGVTYATYVMLLSVFKEKEVSGFLFSFYLSAASSVLILPICLGSGQFRVPGTLPAWIVSMVFSVTLSVGAVVLFQQGTRYIGGQKAAILSTLEPITSVFVGVLAFGEIITVQTLIGALLVIAASILLAVSE